MPAVHTRLNRYSSAEARFAGEDARAQRGQWLASPQGARIGGQGARDKNCLLPHREPLSTVSTSFPGTV